MSNFTSLRYVRASQRGVLHENGRMVFDMACCDGSGTVSHYDVFDGVELLVNDFTAHRCIETNEAGPLVSIDYCLEGRFECPFSPQDCFVLGPGEMSVHLFDGARRSETAAQFPAGRYVGLTVLIDPAAATAWAAQNLGALAFDAAVILDGVLDGRWCRAGRATSKLASVFGDLAAEAEAMGSRSRMRLKVIELFQLIEGFAFDDQGSAYYPSWQVRVAHDLRDMLARDEAGRMSVDRVAEDNGMTATRLQKVFKAVFGMPVYAYAREHRLERAALALRDTGRSVTDVALEAGFSNPSKFSAAFKQRFGCTPTQYRRMGPHT